MNLPPSIKESLDEIVSKTFMFRQNTQTTITMQTLTMLNGQSPHRVLRQIAAEVSTRRKAIISNYENLKKAEEKYKEETDPEMKAIYLEELKDGVNAYQNTIKDIIVLTKRYEQIKKKHGIDEWTEEDFERAEMRHHVRRGFELLYQNILQHGRPEKSIIEYLQQYGVHPQVAVREVSAYIKKVEEAIDAGHLPDSSILEDFLDAMANKYLQAPKTVCERLFGTDDLVVEEALLPPVETDKLIGGMDDLLRLHHE